MKAFLRRNAAALVASALVHSLLAAAIAFSSVQAARHSRVSFDVTTMKQRKAEHKPSLKHQGPRPGQELPPPVKRPEPKPKPKKKMVDLTKDVPKIKQEPLPLKIREEPKVAEPDEPEVRAVTGVTLSSVTTPGTSGGSWSVPLGNTTFGPPTPKEERPKEIPKLPPRRAFTIDREPVLLERPDVDYPEDARRMGIEGKVLLKLEIDDKGRVTKVVLVKGLYPSLDRLAVESARKMLFKPAMAGGEPVPVKILYSYIFELEDEW